MIRARNNPVEEPKERKPQSPKRTTGGAAKDQATFAGTLSASSLHLYQSFKQQAKRKKSAVIWTKNSNEIWTVEVPKRMLFSTLGVFLVLPLLIFVWKELHPARNASSELRGTKQKITHNGKNKYVTWMEDNLPEFNETEVEQEESGLVGKPKSVMQVVIAEEPSTTKLTKNETVKKEMKEEADTFLSISGNKIDSKKDTTNDYRKHVIAQLDGEETATRENKSGDVTDVGQNSNDNMEEQLKTMKRLFDETAQKKKPAQITTSIGDDAVDDDTEDRSTA